jgi:hypothetical protein
MHPPVRRFKFSGRIAPDDFAHRVQTTAAAADTVAPSYVSVPGIGNVPQYAPTIGAASVSYNPAQDCNGCFMSYKFQPNNNCYNYSCNIATNSFAQPGRRHGYQIPQLTGAGVQAGAEKDGLIFIGTTIADIRKHAATDGGHYIALLISAPDTATGWPGDYHWVRCDDNANFQSWSQKDGPDQVTNFDFAGNPIADPATSNWTVNQGPISDQNPNDLQATYNFYGYMYVPWGKVDII